MIAILESEIVVIGGGIAGASVALHLAEHGRQVTIIERGEIASEASGLNMGGLGGMGWGKSPDLQSHLTMGSLDIFRRLQLDMGYDIEFRLSGTLQAVQTDEEFDYARNRVKTLTEQCYELALLTPREARAIEPEASPDIKGYVLVSQRGQADPVKATKAFASAAGAQGAKVLTGHGLTGIEQTSDGTYTLATTQGEIHCEHLVVAAGAWCSQVGAMMSLDIPIVAVRGQMWATESLPPSVFHTVSGAESALRWQNDPGNDETNPSDLTHIDGRRMTRHLYGRQRRNGEIVFGGDREAVGYVSNVDPQGIEVNKSHVGEVLPFLKNVPIKRTWSGLMPFPLHGKPIIGRIPQRDNLYVVTGLASSGFGRGPMAGKFVADLLHSGEAHQVLSEADPALCVKEA